MPHTKNVGILLSSICDVSKNGITRRIAAELEDVGLVLNNINVNVTSAQRHHTSTSVNGVFVLVNLNCSI